MIRRLMIALVAVLGALAIAVVALASHSDNGMPRSGSIPRAAFHAFYDDHVVVYLATDVSDKAEAKMMHANYAPKLKAAMKAADEMYVFQGKTAVGQLPVFDSQPGEAKYSPLWHETYVSWKAGVTPSLIKKDDDIESMIKAGKMTEHESTIVLNCPIVKPVATAISESS